MSQNSQLPNYVASAQPNPQNKRAGWLTTTAATYAGVMLWFVFWQDVPLGDGGVAGGTLSQGLPFAIVSLVIAALLCHFLYYLAPGLLGLKTGLPLAVVGTSTYGVTGGYFLPGLLMGLLQFGWLSVNAYFSALLLAATFGQGAGSPLHLGIGVVWALIAMFVGLKGIQYVGKVASYMPIIPIVILILLLAKTIGGVGSFSLDELKSGPEKAAAAKVAIAEKIQSDSAKTEEEKKDAQIVAEDAVKFAQAAKPAVLYGSGQLGILSLLCTYVIGFFATAGAAGVGFGSGNKDAKAVQLGGIVGIILPTVVSGIIAIVAVAGIQKQAMEHPEFLATYNVPGLFGLIFGQTGSKICMFLLAIAAFPSACFCTLIAADCIKTSFPKINPWASCGVGVLAAIVLVVSRYAADAPSVFKVIGASFGPICGAMAADYLLSGKKWAGPRAGFNPAGWLSWLIGFLVGAAKLVLGASLPFDIPCPPLSAFIVGFVLYLIFAKAGLESQKLDLPQRIDK
ncbi:MAG: cytosine permease [Planctomycetaceae bacterium]|nr:cytosine permease [Planctomycetaceae bacterium]